MDSLHPSSCRVAVTMAQRPSRTRRACQACALTPHLRSPYLQSQVPQYWRGAVPLQEKAQACRHSHHARQSAGRCKARYRIDSHAERAIHENLQLFPATTDFSLSARADSHPGAVGEVHIVHIALSTAHGNLHVHPHLAVAGLMHCCLQIFRFSVWAGKPTPGSALMNLRYRNERLIQTQPTSSLGSNALDTGQAGHQTRVAHTVSTSSASTSFPPVLVLSSTHLHCDHQAEFTKILGDVTQDSILSCTTAAERTIVLPKGITAS